MKLSVHLFLTDIIPEKRRLLNMAVKNKIFANKPAKKVFADLKKAGINGFEVLLPTFVNIQDLRDLKKVTKANKMEIFSVHQALRFITKTHLSEVKKLFEQASILSAKVIVLHMNSAKKQIFDQKYIDEIHGLQKKYGIKVGFENMEKHAGSIMNGSVWHEQKFADVMDKNNFNITLDTCHLGQSGGDIIKFFKKNKKRIINIHFSDYKPHYLNNSLRPLRFKHLILGKGKLPIDEFLQTLKNEKYKGFLTMEIYTDLAGLLNSADIIRNATSKSVKTKL